MQNDKIIPPKLLVVVGPTATGKSALAIELAERFGGEILCADSRTVYRGMDIGTAKPSQGDQARVPHHGLDLVDPSHPFTAADYKVYASQTITGIDSRGKLPIMVGGSGMYIDAVLYDYQFRHTADPELRERLSGLSVEDLQAKVLAMGLELPADAENPRRLTRVIESGGVAGAEDRQTGIRPYTLVLGLDFNIDVLEARISRRVDAMVGQGLADEVAQLGDTYGWEAQALKAPGYRAFKDFIAGEITLEEAKLEFIKNDRALAKRQKTWFKRNKSIHWLTTEDKLAEAVDIATTFLNT